MTQQTLFDKSTIEGGAIFSPCETWRYALWRIWDFSDSPNCVAFIGLNPSTADAIQDDPTIRRCIRFVQGWGFGGLYMLNAFAYRATQPRDMRKAADPIGPGNDEAIAEYVKRCSLVVAAWGANMRRTPERTEQILALLRGQDVHCLRLLDDGTPEHPLFIPKTCKPQPWRMAK